MLMSATIMFHPFLANSKDNALPKPLPAPVITTRLFGNFFMGSILF
jgi:hypothetical protein